MPELIKQGKYIRPALGIEIDQQMNERLVELTGTAGVAVLRVQPGSAADKAGLQGVAISADGIVPGDFIIAINGKEVDSLSKLFARLDDQKVGDVVKVQVINNGQAREVEVTLQPGT
ncbi:PDZ domain-containing protein [Methylomonas methanica]|uniref:PDZ domain-containing protein n=1 Tax=Methylomonas methanica TaxID=421 RepID=A0ABY2CT86_METMH|nr:PDZ domain-containing protein [Methylomonas methanica]